MKIIGPATAEEVAAAFSTDAGTTFARVHDEQRQFECKRCERTFFAPPNAFIFLGLCDPCFAIHEDEKWRANYERSIGS